MSDLELFPTINPNLDELVEPEKNIVMKVEDKRHLKQNDIFDSKYLNKKEVKGTKTGGKTKVLKELPPKEPTQRVQPCQQDQGKSASLEKYPHLKAARAKGIVTRKEKARIRREAKEEAKKLKDIEKQERREATKERNRVKARDRYRRIKAEKDATKPIDIPIARKKQYIPNSVDKLSFTDFSNYMMRYEDIKGKWEKQQKLKKQQTIDRDKNLKIHKKTTEKLKKEFPDNYPLSHLYGKNRFKTADFNNF
tara:strand:- start:4105 stop:4857 length:753 start_codon:yes stop_codon:yes gene_type:complete